jgi:pyridoxine kinase
MWEGIKTQSLEFDAVLTGYMADPDQIDLAADIIRDVRRSNRNAVILVDPVMGDNGRLYVKNEIAAGIKTTLLPLAKIITPNVWELEYLTDTPLTSREVIFTAAQNLHNGTLVTSVPAQGHIGAAYISDSVAAMVSHRRFDTIPHGGGDALAATFLAHILNGHRPEAALAKSVAGVFDIISAGVARDAGELPLVRQQDALIDARPLRIERYRI